MKKPLRLERIFLIILLVSPVMGVILFIVYLISSNPGNIPTLVNLYPEWLRTYGHGNSGGGGYISAIPIYLGLMAISGSIQLKGTYTK
jgi:hypothetical protein